MTKNGFEFPGCAGLRVVSLLVATMMLSCGTSDEISDGELSVRVLYPASGLGDRSYSDSVYAGLVAASTDTSFQVTSATPADQSIAAQTLADWTGAAPEDTGLIIVVGGDRTGQIDDLACQFGGWNLMLVDGLAVDCPGLESHVFDVFPASFLAGVAAMAVSTQGRAAVLGGRSDPVVNRYVRGFAAGVAWAGGEVTEIRYLSDGEDGFSDPEGARAAAEELFQAADIVFPVAGASGPGVFAAAEASPGRYAFGVDVDQTILAPGVVPGSVVKHLNQAVSDAVRRASLGTFAPEEDGGAETGGPQVWTADLVLNLDLAAAAEGPVEAATEASVAAGKADLAAHPW